MFEKTCENSPRALNGWRLITTPKANGVRLGDKKKGSERHRYTGVRQTVARGTRHFATLFDK
jgi:hypothetical protein